MQTGASPAQRSTPSGRARSPSAIAAWPRHAGAELQPGDVHCGFLLALSTGDTHHHFACICTPLSSSLRKRQRTKHHVLTCFQHFPSLRGKARSQLQLGSKGKTGMHTKTTMYTSGVGHAAILLLKLKRCSSSNTKLYIRRVQAYLVTGQ